MKKLFFTINLFLVIYLSNAQNSISGSSFAPVGAKWTFSIDYGGMCGSGGKGYESYSILKDTLVNGNIYKKAIKISKPARLDFDQNKNEKILTTTGIFFRKLGGKSQINFDIKQAYWSTLYDSSWTQNTTCNANLNFYSKDSVQVKVIKTGIDTINGFTLKYSVLKALDPKLFDNQDSTLKFYENIGNIAYFKPKIIEKGMVADYCQWESLNCYSDSSMNIKLLNTDCEYFKLNPTAIAESISTILEIYPNPAQSALFLKDKIIEQSSYTIFNSLGSIVSNGNLASDNQIDISSMQNGFYQIKIQTKAKSYVARFVKE